MDPGYMPYLESPNTGSTPPTWDTGGELILRVGFLLACSIEEEFIDEDDDDDSLVRLLTPYNRIEHSTGYTISAIDSERGY